MGRVREALDAYNRKETPSKSEFGVKYVYIAADEVREIRKLKPRKEE